MSLLRVAVFLAVGIGFGVAGGVGAYGMLPRSPYVDGLWVGDERLPPPRDLATWMERRQEEVRERRVVLHYGDDLEETTYGELGIELDVSKTMSRVTAIGHIGSLAERVAEARRARRGEIEVPLVYRVNDVKAREILERIAERIHRDPVDAWMDLANRTKHPDVPGRTLDVDLSLGVVLEASYDDVNGASLVLPQRVVHAKVRTEDLVDVDVTKTLAAHETTFATYGVGVGRSQNIARAAKGLDGTIIPPGATVSFNQLVGARTLERGFTWAPEIQGDEMTTGIGGGTCQVSSTLFIAALFGALEIVERQSHSRPSAYAKLGLDATVVYDKVDLKLRNPFTFPIMLHVFLPKPGVVRVEILGGEPQAEVSYKYGVGHIENFYRRITVKSHLKPGTRVRRQKGSRGMDVTSLVTIKWRDGRLEERTFFSGYRPAPEVYWIAPGYDEGELPPLPDNAKGIEGRPYGEAYASSAL